MRTKTRMWRSAYDGIAMFKELIALRGTTGLIEESWITRAPLLYASSSPLAVQVRSSFEPRVEPFPHCVLCLAPSSLPCPQQRGANLTIPARVCAQEAASASIMSIPNGRIHLGAPPAPRAHPSALAP